MKRLLSILLALTMLLSLTACGGGNDAAPGGGAVLCLLGVLPGGGRAPARGGGDAAGLLPCGDGPVRSGPGPGRAAPPVADRPGYRRINGTDGLRPRGAGRLCLWSAGRRRRAVGRGTVDRRDIRPAGGL